MSRSRYCKVCLGWHNLLEPWPVECFRGEAPNPAPNIRPDGMDAIRNHADGKIHDSKSAYYKAVRAAGCEIVGNDPRGLAPPPEYRPTGIREDIRAALGKHGVL